MNKGSMPGYQARITLEPGRLKLLSKAIGSPDWRRLPLTLPFCLISDDDRFANFLVDAMKDWGLDIARTMHASQRFEYHKGMAAGDVLDVTLHLRDRYTKKGGSLAFTELEGQIFDAGGELVAEQQITLVTVARDIGTEVQP